MNCANEAKRTTDNVRKLIEIQENFEDVQIGDRADRFFVYEMDCKEVGTKRGVRSRSSCVTSIMCSCSCTINLHYDT